MNDQCLGPLPCRDLDPVSDSDRDVLHARCDVSAPCWKVLITAFGKRGVGGTPAKAAAPTSLHMRGRAGLRAVVEYNPACQARYPSAKKSLRVVGPGILYKDQLLRTSLNFNIISRGFNIFTWGLRYGDLLRVAFRQTILFFTGDSVRVWWDLDGLHAWIFLRSRPP